MVPGNPNFVTKQRSGKSVLLEEAAPAACHYGFPADTLPGNLMTGLWLREIFRKIGRPRNLQRLSITTVAMLPSVA